jgi:hypothetical protein
MDARRQTAAVADVRRAWWSLLGFVPALGLAFAVGEGLAAALGHPPGDADAAPWGVLVVAGGFVLLNLVSGVAVLLAA